MEPAVAGDLCALEKLSQTEHGFPGGKDPWLGRHWLTNAIDCASAAVVRWMLDRGASPIFRDDEGYTCLHSAIDREANDKYDVMAILIEYGADVNAHGLNDWTPAHMAAARNDIGALRILHAANADFSIRTRIDSFTTPLEEACDLGSSAEVIGFLESIQ